MHQVQEFPSTKGLKGISDKTNEIHHGKLYTGYVNKRNEVEEKLSGLAEEDWKAANQVYSKLRGLKHEETFAANGMILHEVFFGILGGDGNPEGTKIKEAIEKEWGSWDAFVTQFSACGMVARGWAIVAYDPSDKKLHIYCADAQNQGGVWGSVPLVTLDVYEHAYMIDFGADRPRYIKAFLENIDWKKVDERFEKANSN